MDLILGAFLPDGLTPIVVLGLVTVSMIGTLLTSSIGLGGGSFLLSIMSLVFPPAILIPVHGTVQMGNNFGRAFVNRRFIQWQMVLWMALGSFVGAAIGVNFASLLPENIFRTVIGVYLLISIWLPNPDVKTRGPIESFIGGILTSFLGMVVGISGPLVFTFLRVIKDRRQLVATHAMLMSLQNTSKVVAFMVFGFAFSAYLPLILAMVAAGFVGTNIGSRLLGVLPEKTFRIVFRVLISAIAFELIRRGIFAI